jgi:hypothetical protein
LKAQIEHARLMQLHSDIKARASVPTYQKLPRAWLPRPFDVRILPDSVQDPIHYFELFWTPEVWNTLVENTNAYAQYKEARNKENKNKNSRWWKAVDLYEIQIYIALLIYIGIYKNSNIEDFWSKEITIHKPIEYISYFCFQQIKHYFHVSPPPVSNNPTHLPIKLWYMKLALLYILLQKHFQIYTILGQNVSFDEIMVAFTGRSRHTLKMKNKPISEGFKLWALYDYSYI